MTVRIKLAQTTDELDQLFQLRHSVFIDEKSYLPAVNDGRLVDRFDPLPAAGNIIAVVEGRVVGGVRVVEDVPGVGRSSDPLFDFTPYLPSPPARTATGSMLVVDKKYRRTPRLTFSLLGMTYYWCAARNISHVFAVASPDSEPIFLNTGYRPLTERFLHEKTNLWVRPVILQVDSLAERFLAFVKRHNIHHVLGAFERQFHREGEVIIRRGDEGQAAYVIVEGRVGVRLEDEGELVAELGPGELFGEVALLTARPRMANVVALTDVDLMVLERTTFRERLIESPLAALEVLEMLGDRLAGLSERAITAR